MTIILLAFVLLTIGFLFYREHVEAATETPTSNFEYEILENGTIKINDFTGTEKDVVIPEKINGKEVTIIGGNAFKDKEFSRIVFPNSIKNIEDKAFNESTIEKAYFNKTLEEYLEINFKSNWGTACKYDIYIKKIMNLLKL